jgi:hypothetical protein
LLVGGIDGVQLTVGQGEGLLDEDVLAGLQGGDHLPGVGVVAGGDQDGVDVGIVEEDLVVRGAVRYSELLSGGSAA